MYWNLKQFTLIAQTFSPTCCFSKPMKFMLNKLTKSKNKDVLTLNDFGLQKLEIQSSRLALLEILEDRYGIRSTVIVS